MIASSQTARPRMPTWRMAALRAALWMLVAAGPVGAAAVWIQLDAIDSQLQLLAAQTAAPPAVDTAEVEGVAELVIADFIAGSASAGSSASSVVTTVSLGAEEVDTDYFAVTVATTRVGGEVEEPFRVYQIGVVASGSGWVVVGPPALVAGPITTLNPDTRMSMAGVEDTPGLATAAQGFLAAYLTGDGDVSRYTSPGLAITGVAPPPFESVEILEAGSILHDEGRLVVVTVEGSDLYGRIKVLRYSMAMTELSGRWEVTDLLPAPPLESIEGKGD